MATFEGNQYENFKQKLLDEIQYQRVEHQLTWGSALKALVEVVAYLMDWEKDEWRDPNGQPTFNAGRK